VRYSPAGLSWLRLPGNLSADLLLLAFVIFAMWETYRPRRTLCAPAGHRWIHNALLGLLVNSPLTWIYPASAVTLAVAVSGSDYGLLNRSFPPFWLRCALSFLLLDLLRYALHRLHHAVPLLWRIHRVHHSDPEFDWSTGLRFHPGEQLVMQGSYLAVVAILAPPPLAVLCAELVTLVQNIFEHANVAIPRRVDAWLRRLLVTPDMHRVHHSDDYAEQNTNYGTVFSWWDRIFRTYVQEPAARHEQMAMGMRELPGTRSLNVLGMLALPFRNLPAAAAGGKIQTIEAAGSPTQVVGTSIDATSV
jgi:sterol desaturase/sphingolipid hydroxylase (fatty acid hydroxylase superfamily)